MRARFREEWRWIRMGISFFLTVSACVAITAFATASWGALPTVSTGSGLTSTMWNDLVSQVNTMANQPSIKAWGNFDGGYYTACSPGCPIRGSSNIASITRTSAGHYAVTFTNPMPDTKYAVVFGGPGIIWWGTYNAPIVVGNDYQNASNTTTGFNIVSSFPGNAYVDASAVSFAVIR